jgi:hypothetical protein
MWWHSTCLGKGMAIKVGPGSMGGHLLLAPDQKHEGMLRMTQPSPSTHRRFLILRQ